MRFIISLSRGVGTGEGQAPPPKFSKLPFFRWESALCVREKCCSDRILEWPLINANIFGKYFLGVLYDCIYFSPPPRAVAREGIGGGLTHQLLAIRKITAIL
jgi:hypothetical protein